MKHLSFEVWLLAMLLLLCTVPQASASHAMGADLTYTCLGGNQYTLRVSFYRDCAGVPHTNFATVIANSASCGQNLTFNLNLLAGYPVEVSPLCPAELINSRCNNGTLPGVEEYVYEATVTLPMNCSDWVFSYLTGGRNSAITTLNVSTSGNIYVEATLNSIVAPCNSSPDFTSIPVPYICAGQPYTYNHSAIDPDGDVLVYSLVDARITAGTSVTYLAGFSGTNPLTSAPPLSINPANGNLAMQPVGPQVAVIAVRVEEYRGGILIGSTIRDMQVTVLTCTNNTPLINPITSVTGATQTGPFSVDVCPGVPLSFDIPGVDADASQNLNWSWNNSIPGGVLAAGSGASPVSATFSWTPTGADTGLNSLIVNLQDDACPVLGQTTFAIDINVVQGAYAGPDQVYCVAGGPVPLNAGGGSSWVWSILSGSPGSLSCTTCQAPSATPSVPTTYAVETNLAGPCKVRDTVVVAVAPSFSLTMGGAATVCLTGSAALSATPAPAGAYTYAWSPALSLSAANISNPLATPAATTTYNVSVTSPAGCVVTGSQTFNVVNEVLGVTPTASPGVSCQGSPVTLTSNASTDACQRYTTTSIPYVAPPAGGTLVAAGEDVLDGPFNIGFNFNFSCNTYSQLYISTNGFVTFDPASGNGCCVGGLIPSALIPNSMIAVAWSNLSTTTTGSITYQTLGVAPNRRFVVNFNGVPEFGLAPPVVTATLILYETTNVVEIHNTSVAVTNPATQGIENNLGTIAHAVPGRNSAYWTANNDAFRFTPIPSLPITVNWQSPLGADIATGSSTIVSPTVPTTYYAIASNGVCVDLDSVRVDAAFVNAGPDISICPAGQNAALNAIYTGPNPPVNCTTYTVASIPFAPEPGVGTPMTLGDDIVVNIPIGFPFNFFCINYVTARVSTNGFITFDPLSGPGCCGGQFLPNPLRPNAVIAAAWDDLFSPGVGSIHTRTIGAAPNRRFVLTYDGIPTCCGSVPQITSQVILYETTNVIEVHTTQAVNLSPGTMGIENEVGTIAFPIAGRNASAWTASNEAWRFTPLGSPLSYTWTPATGLSSTFIPNPTAVGVTSPITYTVTVNNNICQVSDQVSITICLPVERLLLSAEKEGEVVRLDWEAFDERNLARYDIERSGDGVAWEKIGTSAARNEPDTTLTYQSYDRAPLPGTNIYRLRTVDLDGLTAFSNTVEVQSAEVDWFSVTPNPGSGLFLFDCVLASEKLEIEVYAVDGRQVWALQREGLPLGQHSETLDLRLLPAGTYLYTVKTGQDRSSGRLVKSE